MPAQNIDEEENEVPDNALSLSEDDEFVADLDETDICSITTNLVNNDPHATHISAISV